jgi:hypothetical protein
VLRRLLHQLATVGDDEGARRAGRRGLNAVNEMCKDDLGEKSRKVSYSKIFCLYVKKKISVKQKWVSLSLSSHCR